MRRYKRPLELRDLLGFHNGSLHVLLLLLLDLQLHDWVLYILILLSLDVDVLVHRGRGDLLVEDHTRVQEEVLPDPDGGTSAPGHAALRNRPRSKRNTLGKKFLKNDSLIKFRFCVLRKVWLHRK